MKFRKAVKWGLIAVFLLILIVFVGCEHISFPVLNENKCISCGDCMAVCSYDAIHFENGKPVIDVNKCTGCGECVEVCPTGALSMP